MPTDNEFVQGCIGVVKDLFLEFETPFVELLANDVSQQTMSLLATLEAFFLESRTARPRYRVHQLNDINNNDQFDLFLIG